MIKTQEDFFNKVFASQFIARVRKGLLKVCMWEGELETEHNWNILTPKLWSATLCHSHSLLDPNSIRAPESPFGRVWLSLPHLSSNWHSNSTVLCSIRRPHITFKLPRGEMDTPQRLRNFFRYLAIGMRHFRYLWNGLSDRHRVEITVMQFTGHSLPVRQSMSVPWEFFSSSHFISQFPPTLFPLITAIRMCHFLPVHHLYWHFWPGQKVKT